MSTDETCCTRRLSVDGHGALLSIMKPIRVKEDVWKCDFVLDLEGSRVRKSACGRDSLQALLCCMRCLRAHFQQCSSVFEYEEGGMEWHGIPPIPGLLDERYADEAEESFRELHAAACRRMPALKARLEAAE